MSKQLLYSSSALFLAACSGEVFDPSWDGGVAFTVAGEVDPAVEVPVDAEVRGAILWAWSLDGGAGVYLEPVPTELRLFRYRLDIPAPFVPEGGDQSLPNGWDGLQAHDVLIGLPVLVITEPGQEPAVSVDAADLFEWVASGQPPQLPVAAMAPDHALVAFDGGLPVERIADAADWTGHCALDAAMPGFTLYRRTHQDCGGWDALADPGTRSEFQGILLAAP